MHDIELKNVKKGFKSHSGEFHQVLDINSLKFDCGQQWGLYGQSGSGKSTFLNLISGMALPDQGRILIGGTDITSLKEGQRDRFRAKNIGYVFQTFNLIQGFTALENVKLGMSFSGSKASYDYARELLCRVGLEERLHYLPHQLSSGQQQRVAIARAIANNPDVLLADEPTGNLDPKTTMDTMELLLEVSQGKILLLVTHDDKVLSQFKNTYCLS